MMTSLISPTRSDKPFPVLVVEDNFAQQLLFQYSLQAGMPQTEGVFVNTPEEALTHLAQCRPGVYSFPKLVLMDVHLPQPDIGWQLLKDLRLHYPFLPVLAFSHDDRPDTILQAYELGAHSFIRKPLALTDWVVCFQNLRNYWLETVTVLTLR